MPDKTEIGSQAKLLLDHHYQRYYAKFGVPLLVHGGKDMTICKKLVSTYGLEVAKSLSDAMFESPDPFILQSGYTFGMLMHMASKLMVGLVRPEVNKHCRAVSASLPAFEAFLAKNNS